MTLFGAIETIEGRVDPGNDPQDREDEVAAAWQFLIDTGVVWQLQGWYGRTAQALIEKGLCHA